jgi:release factor glutamine methyltransferase
MSMSSSSRSSLSPVSPRTPLGSVDTSVIVTRLRAAGCVFAEDEADLLVSAAASPAELAAMVERRVVGLPLEHVLGWAEFCGLRVAVDPGVFVPRRRTEFLVGQAAVLVRRAMAPGIARVARSAGGHTVRAVAPVRPVVVDLCCGSGAVGAALAAASAAIDLYAADIDPAAVRCARRNIGPGGRVYQGDLYDPLPGTLRGRVDVLVANAPYVPTEAIGLLPPEARIYESRVALDGGADGLDMQRRVAADACAWLAPGGHLLIETSEHQAPRTMRTFADHGLVPRVVECADLDATVVIGTRSTERGDPTGRR